LNKMKKSKFKFIDLFAGIGGIRIPFQSMGGECVFTSEYDKYCQMTYRLNHGESASGDIKNISEEIIPRHDVLLAGFPCQPFSLAGVSKKISLGRAHGFDDKKQGNLFFDIARIIKKRKPKILFLENVKNLKSHDKGNTYKVIEKTLTDLGYKIFSQVIDARYYVPQHRERIFIIGFRVDEYSDIDFTFPEKPEKRKWELKGILEKKVDKKYTLSDKLWDYLQKYAQKHREKGNGFGYGLIDPDKDLTTRTLSARYHKDGSEILIKQDGKNPRRLTPRECARLMGFNDDFYIPVSDTQAYRQFGNAVVVPVIEALAKQVLKTVNVYGHSVKRKKKS